MPLTNVQARDVQSLLHPYTQLHKLVDTGPLVLEHGKGVFIYDTQGKEYLEGMSGLWCAGLGFGDEELIEAAREQLSRLPYYHLFGGKGMEPAIELAERLKDIAPMPVSKVFYTSSGSEANDTQIKLAWYYNNARGKPQKKKIISRVKAYHGVTVMAASLTGLPGNHRDFDLPVAGVLHTDCPHHYRFGEAGESEAEFVERIAGNLEALIEREGADTIAAFIAEPVMGAGGVIVPPQGYYPRIVEILKANDILFIDDEVINGFGRTGNWWGCQTMGFTPDTISCAKQLTSAYVPLGAVLLPEEMYQAFVEQSRKIGTFGHGFTYGGHPLGCAVGAKALDIYKSRDIVGRVRGLAPQFAARIGRLADHPLVGDVRCSGLVGGVELVADKASRRSFDLTQGVGLACAKACEAEGLILRAIGDTIAICPPMVISAEELDMLFDRLETALDTTEAHVRRENLR
ncbi:aminotransferase class III-fold pyridoxal phosphate-dependent enzyme [Microvirga tunisiensis]|uniref:Aminotransferase class III-fold pyridoxal phosphate-dependent enzyme n=2 Tax=Pannonibacter tanglangensis TaxID=2750084 RepID=A0A7X5F314_9HYPH|nr:MULTISPECIES: aminotransferase [unclassified Pannonibacter]NBN64314.1 aminotransferase class III-fold pyridoxal phosphate-dependent enzyme [Pannonibacter sp. XCT-34]NBN78847.1 aminotransferase class III-fold pyridoxal phosphate-dependent enzyme [Pannonibacter sp. XCT-53]